MSWRAWTLDAPTWAFIVWWVWFIGWESWALFSGEYWDTWTAHFRPVFTEQMLVWVLGQAFLFWFWIHTFYPRLEQWIIDLIRYAPSHALS